MTTLKQRIHTMYKVIILMKQNSSIFIYIKDNITLKVKNQNTKEEYTQAETRR